MQQLNARSIARSSVKVSSLATNLIFVFHARALFRFVEKSSRLSVELRVRDHRNGLVFAKAKLRFGHKDEKKIFHLPAQRPTRTSERYAERQSAEEAKERASKMKLDLCKRTIECVFAEICSPRW